MRLLALAFAVLLVTGAACQRDPGAPDAGTSEPDDAGPPRMPDETPPVVEFLEPASDCLEGVVTFRVLVKDDGAGVAYVSAEFAARTLDLVDEGDGVYSAAFDVGFLLTGVHPLAVTAIDGENNVTEAARDYGTTREGEHFEEGELACGEPPPVVVDETPPVVEILTPPAAVPAFARDALEVSARVTDDTGPVTAAASFADVTAALVPGAASFRATLDVSGVPEGAHDLVVTASDDAGNSASDTRTVTVDRTPPAVTILEPAAGEERVAYTDVVAEVSDDNGIALVRLYEIGNDEPLASTTTPSPDGRYGLLYRLPCAGLPRQTTFEVRAADRAGNAGSAFVDVTVNAIGCGDEP